MVKATGSETSTDRWFETLTKPIEHWPWGRKVTFVWVVYLVSIAWLVLASKLQNLAVSAVVATVTALVAIVLLWVLRHRLESEEANRGKRLRVTAALAVVGLLVFVLWLVGGHPAGWLLAGVGTMYFAVG